MPYVYVGYEPIHHGRKLFKILLSLKNFGQGRIVYRCDEQKFPEPSFYRVRPTPILIWLQNLKLVFKILLAQPEMDDKFEEGRVVVEKVFRGLRKTEPVNLSTNLGLVTSWAGLYLIYFFLSQGFQLGDPDFRLVPKDEEEKFCRWDQVQDYVSILSREWRKTFSWILCLFLYLRLRNYMHH